ncbi:MAG: nucleotidyltransferase domain-containing protein [Coriobacteriia bacterium]|nr:nucleotidyltransferase domain-containing protein [Coriobacteriia bacterium]
MHDEIKAALAKIEASENVTVLHAVESGSRAWGFASPDSDYDVRFVYLRQPADYLRLDQVRDVIEWQLDETLDVDGWDLAKALRLAHKSNPTVFEWDRSPIVYQTTEAWQSISTELNAYFLPKAGLHHYLSTAKSNYRGYLRGETVRVKKYFYVIRPLLACRWILGNDSPPPMLIDELIEAELEPALRPVVAELLDMKKSLPEIGVSPRIEELNAYIEASIEELGDKIAALPPDEVPGWDGLNELFIRTLG